MDPHYVQSLRYKLQKRVARLNSVEPQIFPFTLMQFFRFFDRQPTFTGIISDLLAQLPQYAEDVERILAGETLHGESEEEAAALGYAVLRRAADIESEVKLLNLGYRYVRGALSNHEAIEAIREVFLEPFYEYVDEQLDDQRAMLALLLRYKHRSEWFHREALWKVSQTERRGEWQLAMDLYSYLYDQGIDFTIEPSSITGEVDLVAAQGTDDPMLLDAKIFDGEGRGKTYVRKAFRQIYTYTQQHNEPFGYLAIYKTTDRDLCFSLPVRSHIPVMVHNHKTIFFVTIDIFPYKEPVSQRAPLEAIVITHQELVAILDEGEEDL